MFNFAIHNVQKKEEICSETILNMLEIQQPEGRTRAKRGQRQQSIHIHCPPPYNDQRDGAGYKWDSAPMT